MNTHTPLIASALLAVSLFSGVAQAALHDRGGGLIYDDVLNVTWLQDANYAKTSGYDADGMMKWAGANAWASNLSYYDSVHNVNYDDWRLPTVTPANGVSYDYAYSSDGSTDVGSNITSPNSELSYMFYVNLGNSFSGAYPNNVDNVGPFSNLWHDLSVYPPGTVNIYWYETAYLSAAWGFWISGGAQFAALNPDLDSFAWAVRDGDVAAIPEASTYSMMLAGLGLVGFMARRRKQAKA